MLSDMIHKPAEEEKEKHTPDILIVDEKTVKLMCGKEILHPSTDKHYIAWLKLYGIDKDDKLHELGTHYPTPVLSDPVAYFTVDVNNYKAFHAIEFCNIHGLWENEKKM